ncbi:unannotated protein [freshwater metagenome]|uniref:Unannotated protein n=1 Tax=freshwater metagenome TaxID=449393 RepID=A0A6J7M2I6_9ZZZZ
MRTGISIKPSGRSANCAISSVLLSISARDIPAAKPPKIILSRPDSAGLKPTPSANNVEIFPSTIIRPSVGGKMPAIDLIKVDLPAPFAPTIPTTLPCGISKFK